MKYPFYIILNVVNAINKHKINSSNDGNLLENGLLTLKWKYWADNIKKPIATEETIKNSLYQIETINNVAVATLAAPTKLLIKVLNPNSSNSLIMLSYLKIQT